MNMLRKKLKRSDVIKRRYELIGASASAKYYLHMMLCDYLDGNFEPAKKKLYFLRKLNDKYPSIFLKLDNHDLGRLQMISRALTNDEYVSKLALHSYADIEEEAYEQEDNLIKAKTERDLYKLLVKNQHLIKKVTGIQDLNIAMIEQETEYGFIDLMAYSKVYAIPIEVKLNYANHKIVGQIAKYIKSYMKRVNYMIWRDVIGITIAKEYSQNAKQELKKLNVIPLTYSIFNNNLQIKKLR